MSESTIKRVDFTVKRPDFEAWMAKVRAAFAAASSSASRAARAFRRCDAILRQVEARDRAAMRAKLDAGALRRMRHARRALRARLRAAHVRDVVVPARFRDRILSREALRLAPDLEVVGQYGPAHGFGQAVDAPLGQAFASVTAADVAGQGQGQP